MTFSIVKLYHPSHRVPSLEQADDFFTNVFGLASVWRSSLFTAPDPQYPSYPTDYCIFTSIADVFFDCIDPQKYVIDGEQRYETVKFPELNGLGWAVRDIDEIYRRMQEAGFECTDQANRPSDPQHCPVASFKASKLFYTVAKSTGIRYEFYPIESVGPYDHRQNPSWELNAHEAKGKLGVQFCSHHTILTKDLSRALALYVEILGGQVIHRQGQTVRSTDSTFVRLADAIFEFAVPLNDNSVAARDFERRHHATEDIYHALTWKVVDLSVVKQRLKQLQISIVAESDAMIVVDPKNALGIAWGFSTEIVPGDDRLS